MGVSEEIRRVCRSYNIRVSFTSERTIRLLLTMVKDPLPVELVVYQIPSSCGKVYMYIKKTIRRLETRLKEHKDACWKGFTSKSAMAEHAWTEQHPIKWRETMYWTTQEGTRSSCSKKRCIFQQHQKAAILINMKGQSLTSVG